MQVSIESVEKSFNSYAIPALVKLRSIELEGDTLWATIESFDGKSHAFAVNSEKGLTSSREAAYGEEIAFAANDWARRRKQKLGA